MKKELKKKITAQVEVKERREERSPYQVMNWTPHPGGRPTDYKPEFCEEVIAYFDVPPFAEHKTVFGVKRVPNILPTVAGFCHKIGIAKQTFYTWKKEHKEFLDAVMRAAVNQEHMLVTNTLMSLYNHKFAAIVAMNITDMKMLPEETKQSVAVFEIIRLPERYEPSLGQSVIDGTIVASDDLATTSRETNDRSLGEGI